MDAAAQMMLLIRKSRTLPWLAALLVLGLSFQLWAQQREASQGRLSPPPKPETPKPEPAASSTSPARPFAVGESLTYSVSWAGFGSAARIEMQVADQGAFFGHQGLQLISRVQTIGQARSVFLDLDNQYVSYVDGSTMLPHRLETSIKQGARQSQQTVIIDQEGRTARTADDSALTLGADCFDVTSLVYALRMRGVPSSSKAKFTLIYGRDLWDIEAGSDENEKIVVQSGTYDATQIELTARGKSKYKVDLWLTNDKQRLPVLIKAKLPFGEVRAELSSVAFNPRPKQMVGAEKFAEGPKGSKELFAELEKSRPFSVGERLNYSVSWGGFASLGTASFAVRQRGWVGEQRVMELVAEATTNGLARSVIDVDDQMISVVDVKTLHPLRTETRLSEGARKKQVTATFDWADLSVKLTNGTHFKVSADMLDFVSLYYSIRASEFKQGATYSYNVLDANHRPVVLTVRLIKKEMISVPFGTLNTQQLDILDREGKQAMAKVWLSDDARRLPLYIAVATRFGELKFSLTGAVGTR
jgi:hypothetical protein